MLLKRATILSIVLLFLIVITTAKKKKRPTTDWPPTVETDFGTIHKSIYNGTGSFWYYSFSGIRYGRVTDRFTAPSALCDVKKRKCRRVKNKFISLPRIADGLVEDYPKCPQAIPNWTKDETVKFGEDDKQVKHQAKPALIPVPHEEVEDCLYLDIVIPEKVWQLTRGRADRGLLVPVLVWIHGGGFTSGDKGLREGNPVALLKHSLKLYREGMMVVTINYRLGLFGFLSGDTSIMSNVGLLDQRTALGWIQKHIAKFGGDPSQVTVVGEGAGASSIMHHLTAPNISTQFFPDLQSPSHHHRHFPFQSAILQSPTFQPIIPSQSQSNLARVLSKASEITGSKIDKVYKLRRLPYAVLYAVNAAIVRDSPYGTFTFGPAVDYASKHHKSYVPDYPLRRLRDGIMAKDINLLVGQRRNEGRLLTPSTMVTEKGFRAHLAHLFPTVLKRDFDYLSNSIYPTSDYGTFDDSAMNRSIEVINDLFISCNVYYLLNSMVKAYGYILDLSWTSRDTLLERALFSGGSTRLGASNAKDLFQSLQEKFIRFGARSELEYEGKDLKNYHENGKVLYGGDDGFNGYISDPAAKKQCLYWEQVPYEGVT